MAAGLGFKDFVTGEVLTAADVDGYLMQGVWVFASAAARDAAVTSPQEGNFAYLKDTNVTTYYTGSAWANLDTTGMTNPMTTTGDIIYSSPGSTPVRLGIGSTGNVLTVAAGVPSWAAPGGGGATYAVFQDNKASGGGGTFTSGAWQTRDLQTSQFNGITGCSLASNQITLAAGTYIVNAMAPAGFVTQHQTRFYNITDSSTAIIGGNAYNADGSANADTYSALQGAFTIAGSKVFELQHQCSLTRAGTGFGTNNAFGVGEVYSIITIAKVA
jgi:hypothetical protein